MALSLPGTWADLLWTYFGPQMRTGNPFYLAVDSTLIHSLAVMEEPSISIGDALSTFNYACQLLLDKKSTRALLHDLTLKPLQSKFYSTAICLAAQQVLVVEQMLDRDEYSSRAYFPWYRRTLDIHLGNRHENPLAGSDFQRIWSTLRSEIQTMPGSSPASITFKAGRGVDLNRNLPFSQALFTQQDLSFIHTNVQGTLQKESDDSIIKILHRLRANFKRRAKELISKASSDERLRQRLCEQIKSFETTTEQQEEISNRTRAASNLLEWLVAYRDLDNWIDQIYCILIRSELKPIDEPPSEEFLSALIAKAGMVPFVQRDDHYRQVTHTDPFVPYDAVMLLVLRNNLEGVTKHFSQNYPGSKLTTISTNLPEQYLLVDCGELPHSLLFDPQGRMSASSNVS